MRKQLFFICGILLTTVFSAQTNNATEQFEKANILYRQKKYDDAIKLYEQIPQKSAYVNYNLGNCSYKLNKYGYALLYWRRAEKHWGFLNRDELVDNINLLQQKVRKLHGLKTKRHGPIIKALIKIKQLSISMTRSTPLIVLQMLFLLLWLFLFLYIRFLYKKQKKYIISTLFTLIAFFGMVLVARYSMEMRTYGVIVSEQAPLLSGPADTYQTLMQLHQAQELIIKKESKTFLKVKVLRRIGWINKKHIKKI